MEQFWYQQRKNKETYESNNNTKIHTAFAYCKTSLCSKVMK